MSKEQLEELKRSYNELQAQNLRLQERVQELEHELYQDHRQEVLEGLYEQNKLYREAIENLITEWKENVKTTKQHNKSDYSNYRTGLIEGLEFALEELEQALEGSE